MMAEVVACIQQDCSASDDCSHPASDIGDTWGGVGSTTPSYLICPSTTTADNYYLIDNWSQESIAKGNYAASWGSNDYMSYQDPQTAGMFGVLDLGSFILQKDPRCPGIWKMGYGRGTKASDVTDGLSNTLMASEVLTYDSYLDGRGGWVLTAMGSSIFTAKTTPNSTTNDVIPMCEPKIPVGDPLHCTQDQKDGAVFAAAQGAHPGGVVVMYADGSTRFTTNSVDAAVWTALSTRGSRTLPRDRNEYGPVRRRALR